MVMITMHPLSNKITFPLLVASIAITIYWVYSLIVDAHDSLLSELGILTGVLLILSFSVVIKSRRSWEERQNTS